MKLASYKHGRDGRLMVVSKDLTRCIAANEADQSLPSTMQGALDNWANVKPQLEVIAKKLESGNTGEAFDPAECESPLPRAYQIVDGSAYLNHVELVRKARGAEVPESFFSDPLMYQAVSDTVLGPRDSIPVPSEEYGIDFEAEVAVITDDVPMAINAKDAAKHIKLIMIMNDVSLRGLIPAELGKGFGFLQSKPPSAFSPVAVTPDELGDKWKDGKVHLPLLSTYNDKPFGHPNAGVEMQFSFPELIAHAAKTRPLCAGTIVGSGTISNSDRSTGSSCLAEIRMIEKIETGEFVTPFMKYGDTIRIDMQDENGASVFGSIEQEIVPHTQQAQKTTRMAS